MGELLYARLDPQKPNQEELVKRLDSTYKERTYGEMVAKVLDTEGDDLNEPYNAQEKSVVSLINNYDIPQIIVYTNSEPSIEKPVNPEDSISGDLDEIIHEETIVNEEGEEVKIPVINFTVTGGVPGGYRLDTYLR